MSVKEPSDEPVQQILGMPGNEVDRFRAAESAGLVELAPLALPRDPVGDNNRIGWPVRTSVGETIVVVHRRIPGHNPRGAGTGDEDSTFSMVTTSADGGFTWSESRDLRNWMDPDEWDSGEWRLERTLLQRNGEFYRTGDGFHPAGAIIDVDHGVQHIFIYTGHPNGPAGSFRLSRTLDTSRLQSFLTPRPERNTP